MAFRILEASFSTKNIIDMTTKEKLLQKSIDKANKAFSENETGLYANIGFDDNTPSFAYIDIEWGDWKHEHGYADYIMRQNGFVKTDEKVTENDGSDCYSSVHYYRLSA